MSEDIKQQISKTINYVEWVTATLSTLVMLAFLLNEDVSLYLGKMFANELFAYVFLGCAYAYCAYFIYTMGRVAKFAYDHQDEYNVKDYNFGFAIQKVTIMFIILLSASLTFKLTTLELESKRVEAIEHVYDRICANPNVDQAKLIKEQYHDIARKGELDDHPVKFYGWIVYIEAKDKLIINCESFARQVAIRSMR